MTPRIVVLDGHTLTKAKPDENAPEGEPVWDAFSALGALTVHDRTPADQIVPRAAGAQVLLTNKTLLTAETIAALPELRYIGVLATGVNVVDLHAAKSGGIVVTNIPCYGGDAVAQHVFALLLELTNRVADHSQAVHEGQWTDCPDFSFTVAPMTLLAGKTLGIVGAGDIGQRVARIGHALGMDILIHSRTEREVGVPARWVSADEVFMQSDVVSLHCPLTDETHHMADARRVGLMKPSAILINTARGALIDEAALAEALHSGRIAGAALDVLNTEPPDTDNPLLVAPRCIITPHNAWAARESRWRLMNIAVENLDAFLNDEPVNVV